MLIPQVYAQCEPGLEGVANRVNLGDCLQTGDGQPIADVFSDPAFLVNLIIENLFVFGGIILFIMIIYAGLITVMGGKKGFEDARQIVTQAAIGFIIMFCAYWVVALVQLITGVEFGL